MKILMGTKNPGKIEGARQAFEKYFRFEGIERKFSCFQNGNNCR